MKLEDVLPHLRAGGKVKLGKFFTAEYTLDGLFILHKDILKSDDFVMVKDIYKNEHIIDFESYSCYTISNIKQNKFLATSLVELFPNRTNTKYKVTIEEIVE